MRGLVPALLILPVLALAVPAGPAEPVEAADSYLALGIDALLSILQLPRGVPVATMGIGKQGVLNAVLLAERMLKLPRA